MRIRSNKRDGFERKSRNIYFFGKFLEGAGIFLGAAYRIEADHAANQLITGEGDEVFGGGRSIQHLLVSGEQKKNALIIHTYIHQI